MMCCNIQYLGHGAGGGIAPARQVFRLGILIVPDPFKFRVLSLDNFREVTCFGFMLDVFILLWTGR